LDSQKLEKIAKTTFIPTEMLPDGQLTSKGSRKRRPSLKQASNNEKATPIARKRVKKVPVPPTSDSNPSSEDDAPPPVPKPPIDTSTFTFELNVDTVFGSTSVYANGFVLKLGKFDYRSHMTTTIKKVADVAERTKTTSELIEGVAYMTAKGITKANSLKLQVSDDDGWRTVESRVKRWMEKIKEPDSIVVKLVYSYKKLSAKSTAPTQEGSSAESEDDPEELSKRARKVQTFALY
jgi:hypothetical protein